MVLTNYQKTDIQIFVECESTLPGPFYQVIITIMPKADNSQRGKLQANVIYDKTGTTGMIAQNFIKQKS